MLQNINYLFYTLLWKESESSGVDVAPSPGLLETWHLHLMYYYCAAQSFTLQYDTVQYSTVQYGTVRYSMVQYGTVWYSMVQYCTVQYGTVQCGTLWYRTVQYGTVWYSMVHTLEPFDLLFPYTCSSSNLLPPPSFSSQLLHPPAKPPPNSSYLLPKGLRWLMSSYMKRFQCDSAKKSFMVVVVVGGDIQ